MTKKICAPSLPFAISDRMTLRIDNSANRVSPCRIAWPINTNTIEIARNPSKEGMRAAALTVPVRTWRCTTCAVRDAGRIASVTVVINGDRWRGGDLANHYRRSQENYRNGFRNAEQLRAQKKTPTDHLRALASVFDAIQPYAAGSGSNSTAMR